MEAAGLVDLIPTLGFPIVCVIGLACFAWYMVKHMADTNAKNMADVQARCKEREDKLYEEIKENRIINAQAVQVISQYAIKIDEIQKDIGDIKTSITIIKSKEGNL